MYRREEILPGQVDNDAFMMYEGQLNGNLVDHGSREKRHDVVNHAHKSILRPSETVTLSWQHVNVRVNQSSRRWCQKPDPNVKVKQILKDVYGHVNPGTLLAIIGASGSGKTTLLNTLTCRVNTQALNAIGDIRVNGIDVGNGIRNISAYVQQDDLFIATMTVREHLTFRAMLRMDKDISHQRRLKRVEDVISELGLGKCSETIIGDPGRLKGISGGEMKRLSFATEILTNPPLFLCDEPTSGLDSYMAENIVQTLKMFAEKGRTILCTIHQPSSEIFALFDMVLVMAEGRVAFMGTTTNAQRFYESVGFRIPMNFNPADIYIKTMAVIPEKEEKCKRRIDRICDAFQQSNFTKSILQEINVVRKNPNQSGIIFEEAFSNNSRYESPWYVQMSAVFGRCWKTTLREPMVFRIKLIQTLILGVVLGLIYLQLDLDQQGVMNINGILFLFIINVTINNMFGVLNTFPAEVPIFLREYGIGLYRVDIYFVCKFVTEIPGVLFIHLILASICYWMVGLYASVEAFFTFVFVLLLTANTAASFGYIVSAAASSVSTALALASPMTIPLMLFGGFFLNTDSNPIYFIWLEYLSWFKYANELLVLNQWRNIDDISCPPAHPNATCNENCLFPNGAAVLRYLNFNEDNVMLDYACLSGLLVGYRILAFLILFTKARMSVKKVDTKTHINPFTAKVSNNPCAICCVLPFDY